MPESTPHSHEQAPTPTPMDDAAWDARYAEADRVWSGAPNGALVAEVSGMPPGRVLDVGCGEGADAVWLARQGWEVVALDVSRVALDRAAAHAAEAGVEVEWVHAGLVEADLPDWSFDLVSAQYPALLATADDVAEHALVDAVAPGGVLLVVHHADVHHADVHHADVHHADVHHADVHHADVHHADVDSEHARSSGFDPDDYVSPADLLPLLGDGWTIEVDERRERQVSGGAGAHHTHDVVLRARRQR